jgi:hypothetical protein
MASIPKPMDSTESGADRRPLLQLLEEVSILIGSFAATRLGVAYRKMATEVGVSPIYERAMTRQLRCSTLCSRTVPRVGGTLRKLDGRDFSFR